MKHKSNILKFAVAILIVSGRTNLLANPTGLSVVSGTATATTSGSQLDVNVGSSLALLNWSSFNIAAGETTSFLQPSSSSVVINEIGSANASQIYGSLTANGTVILANQHGFYFGPNSYVAVGGNFIATTAPLPPDIGEGGAWQFTGPPPLASIVNYGQINVGSGKSLFLIAENIQNSGTLKVPNGNIGLAAGQSVLLSDRADGRGLAMQVTLPQGSVDNEGKIIADGGTITANAQVINQNGIVQADTVQNQNGVIELTASDELNLGANSQISARGDDSTPGSSGGAVTLQSDNNFSDSAGSEIVTSGGAQGGNGGNVEISAPNILSLDSTIDAGAQNGWSGGIFSLDPENIVLGSSGTTTYPGGTVSANGSGTLTINVDSAFQNITAGSITLEASGNITLSTLWNLSATTGKTTGQLTLEAGGNITLGSTTASDSISDANDWSVSLEAGYNSASGTVASGTSSILLDSGSSIQTSQGAINLTAGDNITVGSGSITTTGGGSILADAIAGNLNCGTKNGSYTYAAGGYSITPGSIGGISTEAGGNVTLEAGNSVIYVPPAVTTGDPGSSGAWGPEVGNVTVVAGGDIIGNFIVANGAGVLESGVSVNNSGNVSILNPTANIGLSGVNEQVNLSLISGSWYAYAANNLYIGTVQNPNGTFNASQRYLNNYAADDEVSFWAGSAITLGLPNAGILPGQNSDAATYPSILSLEAGSGGITILDQLNLSSSSQTSLNIVTLNGGNLNGSPTIFGLFTPIVMGGDSVDPATFENDTTPRVNLDISGSIGNVNSLLLQVLTSATINVGGDIDNFAFEGQNDSPLATTTINVVGNINLQTHDILEIGGPGSFDINVTGNVDLGSSYGVDVIGPAAYTGFTENPAVLNISPYGANLNLMVQGNFSMVQSVLINMGINGSINLNVGGQLDIGSDNFSGAFNEGIYTTSGGSISITAGGDVNVDGSRIATYDGGNVNVTSQTGDVNAGSGGQGGNEVYLAYLDADGGIETPELFISGSGIMATTFSGAPNTVGSITVDAPEGNINANSGGISQLAFNGNHSGTFIDLEAGQDINAEDSGVIGYNLNLKAGGSINGLFIGAGNVNVNAGQNFSGTLVGSGSVTVNAGGSISGSIVGGDISASGDSITASLISTSVSASGDTTGASEGVPTSGVAKDVLPDNTSATTASSDNSDDDWRKKKKGILGQPAGQVTVVLPKS